MLQTALAVIAEDSGSKFEDRVEAYQWLSDNWELERLNLQQQMEFNDLVERGVVQTAPWRAQI